MHEHAGLPEPGADALGGASGGRGGGEYATRARRPLRRRHLRPSVRVEWPRRLSQGLEQPGQGKLIN